MTISWIIVIICAILYCINAVYGIICAFNLWLDDLDDDEEDK